MTSTDRKPWMDDVDPVALDAVRERWRRGMCDADCERLGLALTVPCTKCQAELGAECRNLADGGPTRFGFHVDRGKAAGVRWEPTTTGELAEQRPPRDRTGNDWPAVPPARSQAADDQGWR